VVEIDGFKIEKNIKRMVSNTIENIKNAINNRQIELKNTINFDTVEIHDTVELIKSMYGIKSATIIDINASCENKTRNIKIELEDDFEPEYFIVRFSTHDGTMIFVQQLYKQALYEILSGSTFNRDTAPTDYIKNYMSYDLKYTIGKTYFFNDFGIKNINGNKMQGEDNVLIIPCKIEYIERT
jgi:hypothetical protein